MKRFFSKKYFFPLMLVCSLAVPSAASAAALPFTDVKPSDKAYVDVAYVYEHGLMSGTSDKAFSPNMPYSRAMFVTMLGRLAGIDTGAYAGSAFSDVPAGAWYAPYVKWAAEKGIVSGYSDGRFGPNDTINREQYSVIVCRYLDAMGIQLPAKVQRPHEFGLYDDVEISGYAQERVRDMIERGLLTVYETYPPNYPVEVRPKEGMTRKAVAEEFANLHSRLAEAGLVDTTDAKEVSAEQIARDFSEASMFTRNWFKDFAYGGRSHPIPNRYYQDYVEVCYPGINRTNDVLRLTRQYYTDTVARQFVYGPDIKWEETTTNLYVTPPGEIGSGYMNSCTLDIVKNSDTMYTITVTEDGAFGEDTYDVHYMYQNGYWVFDQEINYDYAYLPITVSSFS